MPPELESCVKGFMHSIYNQKKWPDPKERAKHAWPICRNTLKLANVQEKDNNDLLTWHYWLHGYYWDGNYPDKWSLEDLVNEHVMAIQELRRRGLQHPIWDEFDQKSKVLLSLYPDLTDDDLIKEHDAVHYKWENFVEKRDLYSNEHWLIRLIMEKRGLKHDRLDALDEENYETCPIKLGVIFALHQEKNVLGDLDYNSLIDWLVQFIPERHIFVLTALEKGIFKIIVEAQADKLPKFNPKKVDIK